MTSNRFIWYKLHSVKKLLVTGLLLLCIPLMAQVLQPLGYGLPARVVASYASGDEYLALFEETNTSGDKTCTVARWNGTYWSYYGGLNIPTDVKTINGDYNYHSVVLYHDTMYVGAYISNATRDADNNVNHMYKWDGTSWIPVINGIKSKNDGILAMTVFNNQLIVAGRFQNSLNGNTVQNIASYNGSQWKYMDNTSSQQGTDGFINTLVTEGNRLYIGGKFKNFAGAYTGNIAFFTDANGQWGGVGSPFTGSNAEILELATYNSSLAALGLNNAGQKEIRVFSNGTWSAPLAFDTLSLALPTTIAGAGNYLLIGGKFEKNGNGTSILRYENGGLNFTGTRITGEFALGQRGSEAFVWGNFVEQNTGIKNISKIETNYGDVVGHLFFDKDQDCIKNNNDAPIVKTLVRFQNEADKFYFAVTDSQGRFAIALPEGNYSMQAFAGIHWINNCVSNYAVKVRRGLYSWVSLGQYIPPGIIDAEIHMEAITPPTVNAGDEVHIQLKIKNTGSSLINGSTVQFRHDGRLKAFNSNPKADNYEASTHEATFSLVNLGIGESKSIDVYIQLPADATSADKYSNYFTTGSGFTTTDINTTDNYDTTVLSTQLTDGSVIKTSNLGGTVNYKVMSLGYKVKFTNTSKSLVKRVQLLDTLDPNISVLQVNLTSSYPSDASVVYKEYGKKGKILSVGFENANLTTFEGNPSSSSGYIAYNVILQYQLRHDDKVYNTAVADFDSKWKGTSNTVEVTMFDPNNSISRITGNIAKVYPNPAKSDIHIDFRSFQKGNIEVVDYAGRVVLTQAVLGDATNVNVSSLKAGIYILRCADGSAILSVSR